MNSTHKVYLTDRDNCHVAKGVAMPRSPGRRRVFSVQADDAASKPRSSAGDRLLCDILRVCIIVSGWLLLAAIPVLGQSVKFTLYNANTSGGLVNGPDGALWFTSSSFNGIGRITTSGSITATYSLPTANAFPTGVAVGSDGALWVAERLGNKIARVTTGGAITEYAIPTANAGTYSIAAGPDGALWFTIDGGGDPLSTVAKIGRITTAGAITQFNIPNPLQGAGPVGITAGSDGAIWFTGETGIGRITTSGTITMYPVSDYYLITNGPDGALWFTEPHNNKIGRITTSGAISEYAVPTGSAWPWGIAAGPDGALWFTEWQGNRIGRITTTGSIADYPIAAVNPQPTGIAGGPDGGVWFDATSNIGRVATVPSLAITTTSLPNGVMNSAYASTGLQATGGVPPYSWSGTGLPQGLFVSGSGTLSGNPIFAGSFNITLTVSDAAIPPQSASRSYVIIVVPPALTITSASPLPGVVLGTFYSQTLAASGGTPPDNWSLVSGSPPPGLSLSSAGTIAGTPSGTGSFSFTAQVTDGASVTATKAFSLTVVAPLTITTSSPLPAGFVGNAYSQNLLAAGGFPPYIWSISSGALPAGLSLTSGGSLTGTPTASGSFTFTVQAADTTGATASRAFNLTISAAPTISTLSPTSVAAGGAGFTLTVNGTGLVSGSAIQWNGAPLITNFVSAVQLTASVTANLIATAGTARITVVGPSGVASNALTLAIGVPTLSISNLSPASTTAGGSSFVLTINGSGFIVGSTVQWTSTALSTNYVTGTQLLASVPQNLIATAGSVTVTVANPGGPVSNGLTFTINPTSTTPVLNNLSPSSATAAGLGFTLTVNGSGFVSGDSVRWNGSTLVTTYVNGTQVMASVPASLIASSGSANVTVANPSGIVSNAATFTINSPGGGSLSIITVSPLPAGKVGTPYSQALAASGGSTPYKGWAVISGGLPPGMSLSTLGSFLTGLLNGVPTTPGTFSFTVQVTDSTNTTATKQFSLTITGGAISISANGIVNAASYAGGTVSPGELIAIFGAGLGPATLVGLQLDSRGFVSTTLGGTQVLFDGVAAPMIYTQAGQVSVVVPYEVAGKSSTQVQVLYQGQGSNLVSVPVSSTVPGIFTIDASGHGPGAIVDQDGTINSANNPAPNGSIVFVYATGEGQTNPTGVDGKPDDSPAPTPLSQPVTATIGGVNAQVLYAGGVPGLVSGVLQVNIQIPATIASSNSVPVVLNIGGKPTQANVTLAIGTGGSQGFAITSLSSQSPTALTPLYISTSGVSPNVPATVQFSNNTGFSVTAQPIRIATDGTIVVAVPLYLDPVTRATSSGQVSVVVTQGNRSTAPSTITIQDLPSVSSYGTQLGQISHAFLVYQTMLTARRINELQAYQALPGNKVNASQALATLQTLLKAVIQVRSDVDRVSMNPALVISGGILPNGFPLQFDRNSLDIMDRMIGLHFTEWAPAIASLTTSPQASSPLSERVISPLQLLNLRATRSALPALIPRFVHREVTGEEELSTSAAQAAGGLSGLITAITNAANQISIAKATSDYYANDATAVDKGFAIAGGLGSLYGLVTVAASDATKAAGDIYGGLVSSAGLLNNLGMELGDLAFLMSASSHGGDPAVVAEAWNDLQTNAHSAAINTINTELSLVSYGTDAEAFGSGLVSFLKSSGSQIALQSAALLTATYDCATASGGGCLANIDNTALQAGAETTTIFSSDTQGFGIATGNVQIANSTGLAGAQNEIQLSSNGITLDTMADQSGNYDLFVPLQASPFDYANADFEVIDPFSPAVLGPDVVDLSGLTTAAPFELPLITGVCIDDDAGDPDFDDPDCDEFGLSSNQAFSLMRRAHRSIMPFDLFREKQPMSRHGGKK